MAKRRMRGGWVLVAVATPLLALSVLASQTTLLDQTNQPIRVAPSRVGDVAVYDTYQQYTLDEGGPGANEQSHKLIWSVTGPNETADYAGALHTAIGLTADTFDPTTPGSSSNSITTTWIDQHNRQPVRREIYYGSRFETPLVPGLGVPAFAPAYQGTWNRSIVHFFAMWNPIQIQDGYQPAQLLTYLQGRDLALGDDIGQPIQAIFEEWIPPGSRQHYGFTMRVEQEGMIDGKRVLGIHMFAHELYTIHNEPDAPFNYESWSNATFWFRDGDAYPLRLDWDYTEWWLNENGTTSWNQVHGAQWRVDLRLGSQVVEWGPFDPRHIPDREVERAAGPITQSGTASPLRYPIEAAIRNVENDPALLEFRLWRMQNPTARVSGLLLHPDNAAPAKDPSWRIGYATPAAGSVYTVQTTLGEGGLATNKAIGLGVCPSDRRFDPSLIQPELATLSGLDALWRVFASPAAAAAGPNVFQWGFHQCGPEARPGMLEYVIYGRLADLPRGEPLMRDRIADFIFSYSGSGTVLQAVRDDRKVSNAANVPLGLSQKPSGPAATEGSRPAEIATLAAASAGLSFLLLVAYLYPFAQQGAFTLYSKLVKHQLLDHRLRDQLVHLIRENPGIAPPGMKKATGAAWTTLIYHLAVLRENNLVTSLRDGRHRRYFPVGVIDHGTLGKVALLQNGRTRRIHDVIGAQPGIERAAIARLMDVTPAAVTWHLQRLLGAGLVRSEKQGRLVRYFQNTPLTAPTPLVVASARA